MKQRYSISATHGGSEMVSVPHNRRYNKYIQQAHIDPKGFHETWIHVDLAEAYKEIFDEARRKYNEEQKAKGRSNRQIRDYLKQCKDSKQTNEVYEVIFTIGNRDSHPREKVCRRVLRSVVDEFEKHNPNFKVVGAYYHADEPGAAPHVHLDYIPISRNNKRGMSTQNSLSGALKEQGYVTNHPNDTAQMKWQKDIYDFVEATCRRHGLDIERGVSKKEKRIDTELFKKQTEIKELNAKEMEQRYVITQNNKEIQKVDSELAEKYRERDNLTNHLARMRDEVGTLSQAKAEISKLRKENSILRNALKIMQKAFDFVERSYKKVKNAGGQSFWARTKEYLFSRLGEVEYQEFQSVRHDPTLFGQKSDVRGRDDYFDR